MKLRERKKRVLESIKPDDQKTGFPLSNAFSSAVNDSATTSASIEQDDKKDDNQLLKQHGELDSRSYYYRCNICYKRLASLKSVFKHRDSIHNIKQRHNLKIKHIHVEPDINDPHYYCKPCERGYGNLRAFNHHLRQTHYLFLPKATVKRKVSFGGKVPDPDDPNKYCKACNRTYLCKKYFKSHCRFMHGIESANLDNQNSAPNVVNTDTYCRACDKRLSVRSSYKSHLFAVHHVNWRLKEQKPKDDVLPDVNDPNFYCRSCKKTSANAKNFRQHLIIVHCILISIPRKKKNLKPDINDSNGYCRVCQKTCSSLGLYRKHLRQVHQMALPSLRVSANRENLPAPNNPQHYYDACQKTWEAREGSRNHCNRANLMALNHRSIINPNATIDINDPKFHCAQCEHAYCGKSAFKKHLRRIHHF